MTWHKYKAKRTELDGITFASKGEAACYAELKLLERAGKIKIIELQPKVFLTKTVTMRPDFLIEENGKQIWVEFKGQETAAYRIKRNLWKEFGPGVLRIVKMRGTKPVMFEEVQGGGVK